MHDIKRRCSSFSTGRIEQLYQVPHDEDIRFRMHHGDRTDATHLTRIVQEAQRDEIYNFTAQSHVKVSFETAEQTTNSDGLGTLRLLEGNMHSGYDQACPMKCDTYFAGWHSTCFGDRS